MKKTFLALLSVLFIAVCGMYLFKPQLMGIAAEALSKDMFLSADNDSFDPGVRVGSKFPAIRAWYKGKEITDVSELIHDKGMVFVANRSADW